MRPLSAQSKTGPPNASRREKNTPAPPSSPDKPEVREAGAIPPMSEDRRKRYAAVALATHGRDASGQTHFYITGSFFSSSPQSPIMPTDSTDGAHWRTTRDSSSTACAQGSNPVPASGTLYVSSEESVPAGQMRTPRASF